MNQSSTITGVGRDELAALDLFASADLDRLAPMLRSCELRLLTAGETLIAVGDHNRSLYLLLSGELSVHLESRDSPSLTTIRAGSTVGEISLVDRKPASAFVVANTPCRVLVLDDELVWLLADSSHALAYNLLHTLASRLREGNFIIQGDRELIRKYKFHASVDGLTGLFNRFWFDTMLLRQMDRSRRSGEALSLLLLDVDYFKQFNDQNGHVVGDYALQNVAGCLRNLVRPTDLLARFGGEEFAVVLPGAAVRQARQIAERLREAVASEPLQIDERPDLPALTVSVGLAQFAADQSRDSFVENADRALYRAKRGGRNRVSD